MTEPVTRHLFFRVEGVVMRDPPGSPCLASGMGELLRELCGDFSLWLFCEPAAKDKASALEGLDGVVPREHRFFASPRFREDAPQELINGIVERAGVLPQELLWIDNRPAVTAAVIRAGMNAVAFVDVFRLRRNLVLRGLVK